MNFASASAFAGQQVMREEAGRVELGPEPTVSFVRGQCGAAGLTVNPKSPWVWWPSGERARHSTL